MRWVLAGLAAVIVAVGCAGDDDRTGGAGETPTPAPEVEGFVYQLQGYADGRLDELAEAPQDLAVIDLARDGHEDWFTAEEIGDLRDSDKTVLAYVAIGTIEDFRPEYPDLLDDVILNRWPEWPEEHFVRYWAPVWWNTVVRPRVDRAIAAGFDGVYLDTLLAYETIDLSLAEGDDRGTLGRKMAELVARISRYGKQQDPGFLVFPQNSPELRHQPGYVDAIDGLGIEELFFTADDHASDRPCVQDWCAENLADVLALRDAGKVILAVDYAAEPANVASACDRYDEEGFAGYVTDRALATVSPPCR
jgi:cysteinyl-tRNA synthetase